MIDVRNLRVRSLMTHVNGIYWSIDTSEDTLDYVFQVLRSESVAGPYTELSKPFQERVCFFDNTVLSYHAARSYVYKLRVKNRVTGDTKDFGPVDHQPDADILATEVKRHMQILFREFAGRRCWLFPVKTFGQRCSCWNQILSKRTKSGCSVCYDTGYIRGYLSPIEVWAQIDPGSNLGEQNTSVGVMQQVNSTARLADIGGIKPRDILVEPENRRWRIISVNQTEHSRSAIHIELQIHEIPANEIEYSLPINMVEPLENLWLSPARNFTNPQNLETFEQEEIPNIYSLYGSTYGPTELFVTFCNICLSLLQGGVYEEVCLF